MPPCAAMLCARRGLSWMQKLSTLYPSSPSADAADAPASPVPTTMTVYLRRFAGLTSFDSKRWRSHFSASGPPGVLESSVITLSSQIDPDGNDGEAGADHDGEHRAPYDEALRVERVVGADRLERAGNP